jgi:hypothetical protein
MDFVQWSELVGEWSQSDSWGNEFVMGQSSASKNGMTEAENIFGIRHQVKIGKYTADWEDSMCCSAVQIVLICDSAIVTCSYDLSSVQWIQLPIQTPSIVTLLRYNII